jgi:hypothetical protein
MFPHKTEEPSPCSGLKFQTSRPKDPEKLCLGDFAGAQAAGANLNALRGTVHHGADALDIWVPSSARSNMRMAHALAKRWFLSTGFTYRSHDLHVPSTQLQSLYWAVCKCCGPHEGLRARLPSNRQTIASSPYVRSRQFICVGHTASPATFDAQCDASS